ncbi:helicase-associated domain-containing protein [Streptomyces sp. MST-110588]|uniref:helicase-associated domain-containing protein n=1 Tax=Streptomyces sp. MST-110588 TaxID=2833628 RepID=UPI00205F37D1|nr:helicase-associated domain-containing protein [Streptomyces sp. MST-110588]UNO42680.1 helicase-associated domain-containing protein [Streptomyces sp. MST-110588]
MEGLDTLTRSLAQRTPEQLAALLTRHAEPLSRQPAPTRLRALAATLWSYETLHHVVLHLDHPRLHLLAATARISQGLAKESAPVPAAPAPGADYQSLMAHRLSFAHLATEPVPSEEIYAALGADRAGPARDAAVAALRSLYEDGLAAPTEDGRVVVPPRTPQLLGTLDLGPFTPTAPIPDATSDTARGPQSAVGHAAVGHAAVPFPAPRSPHAESQAAASVLAAALDRLLASLAGRPAALRKAGGLALREIKRLAKDAGTTEAQCRLLLDLALAAGLIALTRTPAGTTALPTSAYDDWLTRTPGARLAPVLAAWLTLWAIPTHTPEGETPTALVRGHDRHAPALRYALLATLATLPAGTGLPPLRTALPPLDAEPQPLSKGIQAEDTQETRGTQTPHHNGPVPSSESRPAASHPLLRAAAWHRPLAVTDQPAAEARAAHTLQEAAFLGLTAHGTLTPLGHALLTAPDAARTDATDAHSAPADGLPADDSPLHAALRDLLPPPVHKAHFQADLTAVVPGPPAADLAALLAATADRESEGHAVTWRFGPGSVRRALDGGYRADTLLAGLTEASATGTLPQPLIYLVQDAARAHGRMSVLPVGCCVRSDDQALIRELAAHRALRPLGLRAIAPTVLTSSSEPAATLEALRAAGYAPTLESETGTATIERLPSHRANTPPPARRSAAALALTLAQRLLATP